MRHQSRLRYHLNNFLDLFFPVCCAGCDRPLVLGEQLICTHCRYHLPVTGFHTDPDNEGVRLLGGQVPLVSVLSYLYFDDESRVQQMIHHFKYLGLQELGRKFGEEYGQLLRDSGHESTHANLIVPVPIQAAKLRKRGYNQSQVFAEGIAAILNIPICPDVLSKSPRIKTQVGKGRLARFENLAGAITANEKSAEIQDKHILLADDVLTTGATIVACANALLDAGAGRVSVVTLARKH